MRHFRILFSLLCSAAILLAYGCMADATPAAVDDPDNPVIATLTPYPSPAKQPVSAYPAVDNSGVAATYPYPAAQTGSASLKVTLLSTDNAPVADTAVALVAAEGDKKDTLPKDLNASPAASGKTDASGVLSLQNLPAGNYFLVVQAAGGPVAAQTAADNPAPFLIQIADGAAVAPGPLYAKLK